MRALFVLACAIFSLHALNASAWDTSYLRNFDVSKTSAPVSDVSRMFINEMKEQGILTLIPQDFVLESSLENPVLSQLVDDITLTILRTKMGPEICAKTVKERNIDLFTKFGLSESAIQKNDDICSSTPSSRLDLAPRELSKYFLRKPYIFAFTKSPDSGIDSWTSVWSVMRSTLIVVNPETITAQSLIRSVVHEIYMTLDIKSSYPFKGDPIVSSPDACTVLSALHEPLIRYTLNTYRAFQFENQIVTALGLTVQNLPFSPTQEDLNQISELLVPLFNSNRILAERRAFRKLYAPCFDATKISEKWDVLRNTNLKTASGAPKTLLQFMAEPQLQQLPVTEGFEPGPRPNIGTGTGAKNQKVPNQSLASGTSSKSTLSLQDKNESDSRTQLQRLIKKVDDERPDARLNLKKTDPSEQPSSQGSSLRLRLDD